MIYFPINALAWQAISKRLGALLRRRILRYSDVA
jgi:hypothetical protein